MIKVRTTGPFDDPRYLSIVIDDGRITVKNIDLPEGENLQVSRPVFGYEKHLADEIKRLHAILIDARPYVETCADDALPNPAANVLTKIDAALSA